MITIEQIKAARALLGWNQQDLADASGTSKPAIANLERRLSSPRAETLVGIQSAMEEAGIEFIEGPGVRFNSDILKVQVFKGSDSLQRLWDDIYDSLKRGEEKLIFGVDEEFFQQVKGFDKFIERSHNKGLKGRLLVKEGDKNRPDPTAEYREIPAELFENVPFYVYKNKYAILLWEPEPTVVLIENRAIAETYRKQFNKMWDGAES